MNAYIFKFRNSKGKTLYFTFEALTLQDAEVWADQKAIDSNLSLLSVTKKY